MTTRTDEPDIEDSSSKRAPEGIDPLTTYIGKWQVMADQARLLMDWQDDIASEATAEDAGVAERLSVSGGANRWHVDRMTIADMESVIQLLERTAQGSPRRRAIEALARHWRWKLSKTIEERTHEPEMRRFETETMRIETRFHHADESGIRAELASLERTLTDLARSWEDRARRAKDQRQKARKRHEHPCDELRGTDPHAFAELVCKRKEQEAAAEVAKRLGVLVKRIGDISSCELRAGRSSDMAR